MKTTDGTAVTPDMGIEATGSTNISSYYAVAEIKSSFPQHRTTLDRLVEQIRRYGGELTGWKTGAAGQRRDGHDVIVGVRSKQAPRFAANLPAALWDRDTKIKNPLSILGISRKGGGSQFFLQWSFGTISHETAHAAFVKGVTIDAYTLIRELDATKFYDSRPPLPYIMAILWVQVFPNLVHDKKRKRLYANKKVVIEVEVGRIHRLTSRLAPSSNPECVERSWIVASMEEFVRVGLAKKTGNDDYVVSYAIRKSQPLEWLVRLTATRRQAAQKPPKRSGDSSLDGFMDA